jgi:adenosine deaminase
MDFRTLPKIDLHLHLDGAVRPSTVRDLIVEGGAAAPADTESRCRVSPGCRSLREFLETFEFFLPYLGSSAALRRVARELCEDQAADGVVYFETRFAPTLWLDRGFAPEAAVEAALAGLREGSAETGVRWGLILCGLRRSSPWETMRTVEVARRYRDEGVVGVDLAGDERFPAIHHHPAFDLARRFELPITIHAGEAGPAAHVREAVLMGASRIGHGVHVVDDSAALDYVRDRDVTFEMCLTSNLMTHSVETLESHPFRRLFRDGDRVTLNTDDPGVQASTLSGDFALARSAFGLERADFARLLDTAAGAAFAEPSVRDDLRRIVSEGWK